MSAILVRVAMLIANQSDFYPVQQALSQGVRLPSLFSTTDEKYHAELRRCVNSAFSMSTLVQYEPFVDDITKKFLDQTEALFTFKNALCDFTRWLQFYAADVIGGITYSKRLGFVDRNEDVDGICGYLGRLFSYVGPVSYSSLIMTIVTYCASSQGRPNSNPRFPVAQKSYPSFSR